MRHWGAFIVTLFVLATAAPAYAQEQAAEPPAVQAQEPRKLWTLSYGGFLPGSDMRSYDFANGKDITVGLTWFSGESLGITVQFHRFTSDITGSRYTGGMNATGVEFLFTYQDNGARVQPYIGAGGGIYVANLALAGQGNDVSERLLDLGPLAQAGIRVFLSDRVSLGCYAKYVYLISPFSDVINGFGGMQVPVKSGTSVGIEAGVRF
jgi:hypothetical protein